MSWRVHFVIFQRAQKPKCWQPWCHLWNIQDRNCVKPPVLSYSRVETYVKLLHNVLEISFNAFRTKWKNECLLVCLTSNNITTDKTNLDYCIVVYIIVKSLVFWLMWFPTSTMLWCNKHKRLRIFLSDSYLFFLSFTWVYIWVISLLSISTLIQNIDLTKLSIMLQFFKLCWIMD